MAELFAARIELPEIVLPSERWATPPARAVLKANTEAFAMMTSAPSNPANPNAPPHGAWLLVTVHPDIVIRTPVSRHATPPTEANNTGFRLSPHALTVAADTYVTWSSKSSRLDLPYCE